MAIGLVGVGAKITALILNSIIQVTNGYLGTGPSVATNYSTATIVGTVNVPMLVGHTYLITARVDGTQAVSAGTVTIPIRTGGVTGTAINLFILNQAFASGASVAVSGSAIFKPTSSGTEPVFVTIATTAGVVTVGVNGASVAVQDLGV